MLDTSHSSVTHNHTTWRSIEAEASPNRHADITHFTHPTPFCAIHLYCRAKYRMEITGREALSVILERRRKGEAAGSLCNTPDAACEIPAKAGSSSSKSS